MIDFSLPTQKLLVQHISQNRGKEIYEGSDGWYAPDNVNGRNVRPIRQGRGYNFTEVEFVNTSLKIGYTDSIDVTIIVKVGSVAPTRLFSSVYNNSNGLEIDYITTAVFRCNAFYSGVSDYQGIIGSNGDRPITGDILKMRLKCTDISDLFNNSQVWINDVEIGFSQVSVGTQYAFAANYDIYLGGRENGPSPSIANDHILLYLSYENLTKGENLKYNFEEELGLVAFDASGQGNHGTILLNGSTESAFHVTSNEVPSRANEIGYRTPRILLNDDFVAMQPWANPALPDGWSAWQTPDANKYVEENANGCRIYTTGSDIGIRLNDVFVLGKDYRITFEIYSITGSIDLRCTPYVPQFTTTGTKVVDIINSERTYFYFKRTTSGQLSDTVIRSVLVEELNVIVPANEVIPTQDVLGNTLLDNYQGQVRYDAQVKASSLAHFDTVLYADAPIAEALAPTDTFILKWSGYVETNGASGNGFVLTSIANSPPYTGFEVGMRNLLSGTPDSVVLLLINNYPSLAMEVRWLNIGTGTFAEYELTYDGSGNGSGVTLTRNGILQTRSISIDTLGANSYTSGSNYRIGRRVSGTPSLDVFELGFLDFKVNGVQKFLLGMSETNGLKLFDKSLNKDHFTIDLNGSTDGDQWVTSDLQRPTNLLDGYNRVGNLVEGVVMGWGSKNATTFNLQTYEFEFYLNMYDSKDTDIVQIHGSNTSNGILIMSKVGSLQIYEKAVLYSWTSAQGWAQLGLQKINIKRYGTTGAYTLEVYRNDVLEKTYNPTVDLDYNTAFGINLFARGNNTSSRVPNGIYYWTKYWQLDVSGNRIAQLGEWDFKNMDNNYDIPNTGTDAVLLTDFKSDYAGSIPLSVNIPADPADPANDVLGSPIQIKGNNQLLNAESLFDRNYANAPALSAPQAEDISYDAVGSDITRFYRQRSNKVSDLLSYSDFPEPISDDSVANFDSVLVGEFGDHAEFRASTFKVTAVVKPSVATSNAFFCVWNDFYNTAGAGFRGGFYMNYTSGIFYVSYYNGSDVRLYNQLGIAAPIGETYTIILEYDGVGFTHTVEGIGASTSSDGLTFSTSGGKTLVGSAYQSNTGYISKFSGQVISILYEDTTLNNELINLKFSETQGITWFNSAADRPTNSNAQVILNGSTDGTQWGTSTLQRHHNLLDGYNKAADFQLLGSISAQWNPVAAIDTTGWDWRWTIKYQLRTLTGGYYGIGTASYDKPTARNSYLEWQQRLGGEAKLYYGTGATTYNDFTTGGIFEVGVVYEFKLEYIAGSMKLYIDDVLLVTRGDCAVNSLDRIELASTDGDGDKRNDCIIHEFKFERIDAGNEDVVFDADIANGTPEIIPNKGSEGGNAYWQTTYNISDASGKYVKIPADLNNEGFDVLGNPLIANPDQVIKYNAISNYLVR